MAERVIDYISGIEVPATPEEIEATQVFSKLLVEDYGYPKEHTAIIPFSWLSQNGVDMIPVGWKFPLTIYP